MIYGSVCSGVEAATLAWEPLGWKPLFFSEIEPFPSAVLRQRWPDVSNLGDFTKIKGENIGKIDLLTGGTPCQSFSIAGLRKGLADERGNLSLEFARLAYSAKCRWLLWENVPGVLSSNCGKDFAGFLSLLCGWNVSVPKKGWKRGGIITAAPGCYGVAWRIIDAQYVRVDGYLRALPQRRRRLFVVGYIGDWRHSAAVLFDRASMSRDNPPRRTETEDTAGTTGQGSASWFCRSGVAANAETAEDIAPTLLNRMHKSPPFIFDARGNGNGHVAQTVTGDHAARVNDYMPVVVDPVYCLHGNIVGCDNYGRLLCNKDLCYTLTTEKPHVVNKPEARRLMPLECERLMGFPDNHTRIAWRGKPPELCPDGHRYKACGNSQCVNVMRWLGQRIERVDKMNF